MRKLYLHIGTEKTGTTSIQSFLNKNRMKLSENGYHVLKCSGPRNQRSIASYCMPDNHFDDFFLSQQIDNLEEKTEFRKKLKNAFDKEMSELDDSVHSVIISSEHFHSRLKNVRDVERLRELISNYFSEVTVICYLREQSSLASSLYSTGIKAGVSTDFPTFVENCTPDNPFYNYSSLLERWSTVFSTDSLNVRIFSRDEFYNNDLIDDFCVAVNKELLTFTERKVEVKNESFSSFGIIIGRAINSISSRYDKNGFVNEDRKRALNQISEAFSGHENNVSIEQYESIYNDFQETNQSVAKKYFSNRDCLFFRNPSNSPHIKIDERQVTALANIIYDFKTLSLGTDVNINLLRDAALLLEDIDITMAYKLMKLAEKGRPNGEFIKKKIKEYGDSL